MTVGCFPTRAHSVPPLRDLSDAAWVDFRWASLCAAAFPEGEPGVGNPLGMGYEAPPSGRRRSLCVRESARAPMAKLVDARDLRKLSTG